MPIFLLPVVVVVAWAVVYLIRTKEPPKRARFLKTAGLALLGLFSAFIGMFIVGDTFTDPGGWEAAGYVAIWLVPLVLLVLLAVTTPLNSRRRPLIPRAPAPGPSLRRAGPAR